MTTDLTAARALADAADKAADGATEGPWRWEVNPLHRTVELTGGRQTGRGGDLTVMSFARYGLQGAAPVFWRWKGNLADEPQRADAVAVPEQGREHHAKWFKRIDHPDANFMEQSRQLVPDMAATIRDLCAEVERLREDITTLVRTSAQVAREVFSGSCDHTHQAIDYMEQVARAAAEADYCRRVVASIMGDEG